MPRIGDRPGLAPTPGTPAAAGGAPAPAVTSQPSAGADPAARFDPASKIEVYFTPYDPALQVEAALIDRVTAARKKDATSYAPEQNPYRIRYAVYNLRNPEIVKRLVDAAKAGVDVRVVIDGKQIAPDRPHNTVDETFEAAGLKVIRDDANVGVQERRAAHMLGVHSEHLMHMKARVFSWKDADTGALHKELLSGSLNPGGASNDENLNRISDPAVVALYDDKIDDVIAHQKSDNVWHDDRAINVLFTPSQSGPRPVEKLFQMIDAEKEAILLDVFDLGNLKDPKSGKTLVDKLAEAKARGVTVMVITDRRKSDGVDAQGRPVEMYGQAAPKSDVDEQLEAQGIPVYELVNESSAHSAVHGKVGIFGLSQPKVVTDAGNWTMSAMGSGQKHARNVESFLFLDTQKLGDRRIADRYLSNFLYLLRTYDGQDKDHAPAGQAIAALMKLPGWPQVELDPGALLPPDVGDGWLAGDHPALVGRAGEPGLRVFRSSSTTGVRASTTVRVPFGSEVRYDVVERKPDGSEGARRKDLSLVILGSAGTPRT